MGVSGNILLLHTIRRALSPYRQSLEEAIMFRDNLIKILQNLPLILSDSLDPQEVSLNRVLIFCGFWIIVISAILLVFVFPEKLTQLMGYWQASLASWTTLVTANVAKKIYAPK